MPIDIEWQQMPPQRNSDDSEPRLFPRIVNSQVIKEEKLAEMIAAYGGESRGTAKQVLLSRLFSLKRNTAHTRINPTRSLENDKKLLVSTKRLGAS